MRTFVMGDIHGAHRALVQCLERSGFNYDYDMLIQLGDVADGWPYVYECVEELLKIKNRIDILGNHDEWFMQFLLTTQHPDFWCQGGHQTAKSYLRPFGKENLVTGSRDTGYKSPLTPDMAPAAHHYFFTHQWLYHVDAEMNVFVHAGFDRSLSLKENKQNNPENFYWDRKLISDAITANATKTKLRFSEPFKNIFIGHTATNSIAKSAYGKEIGLKAPFTVPIFVDRIINLDTGAGWDGKLTIMDVETKEYWQSDNVKDLYPDEKGR